MVIWSSPENANKRAVGMTIVELMVVISVIGILAGLTMSIVLSHRYAGRDAERISDVESIARAFETSYMRDATTTSGPSYPTTTTATTVSGYDSLFRRQSLSITKAPDTTTATSIVAATTTAQPQAPTKNQYIYLPLTSSNSLCTTGPTCVRFLLYYRLEGTNTVQVVESIHQQ